MAIVKEKVQQETIEQIEKVLTKHKGDSEALIEVLHQIQQLVGYLPHDLQKKIADQLEVAPGEVASVISFYAHFSDQPRGKFQVALCKGTACYVKGSVDIINKIEQKYDIKAGETTEDGLLSLDVVRCLGACGLSPVMTVNGKAHGMINPEKAINIIEKYLRNEM